MDEVGRRLREAKLASYSKSSPTGDYIEAQREIARGDYRDAMNHLNQADEQLDGIPNFKHRRTLTRVRDGGEGRFGLLPRSGSESWSRTRHPCCAERRRPACAPDRRWSRCMVRPGAPCGRLEHCVRPNVVLMRLAQERIKAIVADQWLVISHSRVPADGRVGALGAERRKDERDDLITIVWVWVNAVKVKSFTPVTSPSLPPLELWAPG